MRWDPVEEALYLLGCDGSTLLARLPLGGKARPSTLVAMILAMVPRGAQG